MVPNEKFDNGTEVVLGQPAEPAEGVTDVQDMAQPDRGPNYDRDQEERRESELQVERDERRQRLGHYQPGRTPAHDTTPPAEQPVEDGLFDPNAETTNESSANYDADETEPNSKENPNPGTPA